MPHDALQLGSSTIDDLFPFHLLVSSDESARLLSVGRVVSRYIDNDGGEMYFNELFEITRPKTSALTAEIVSQYTDKLMFVQLKKGALRLRGQFVQNSSASYLFVGSILADAADSLAGSQVKLTDFSAFDTTPDILILHRFREMQINDQKNQNLQMQEVIQARDQFSSFANTDALTDIANRRGFRMQTEAWCESLEPDHSLFLILIDVDGFKEINDGFGHEAGDTVLRAVAERLSDGASEFGVVGRLGGDEFVLLLRYGKSTAAEPAIERLVNAVQQPVKFDIKEIDLKLSAGVTEVLPEQTFEEIIHKADVAMYHGRSRGRGQIFWYTQEFHEQLEYNRVLAKDLESAIKSSELTPHFQPIVDIHSRVVCSFEVLARWQHHQHGNIPPIQFIPLAEEHNLLPALDRLMLASSLDQLLLWHQQGKDYSLHVNMSAPSIQDSLPDHVLSELDRRGISPEFLTIELTETALIDNTDKVRSVLDALENRGVRTQLDDFGTGYSSLTHLQEFSVSGIKIDRSFVMDACRSEKSKKLLFAILDIAKRLELATVGEGIETLQQFELLEAAGCQYAQGYLLGAPAPASHCEPDNSSDLGLVLAA